MLVRGQHGVNRAWSMPHIYRRHYMHVELSEDQKIKVSDPYSVFKVMRQILLRENEIDREQEHVWVVGLAANNTIV